MTKQEYNNWKIESNKIKFAKYKLDKQNDGVCRGFTDNEYITSIELQSSKCKKATRLTHSTNGVWK